MVRVGSMRSTGWTKARRTGPPLQAPGPLSFLPAQQVEVVICVHDVLVEDPVREQRAS